MTRLPLIAFALAQVLVWGIPSPAVAGVFNVELSDPTRPVDLFVDVHWGTIAIHGDTTAERLVVESRVDPPEDLSDSPLTLVEEDNRVTIEQTSPRPGSFRSANLTIIAPARTNLTLVLRRGGDLRVEAIEGLFDITHLNGSVELENVSGAAAVNASNGSIQASFSRIDPERDLVFTSLNGSVELCLPEDFAARVHLTTAGDPIRSAFEVRQQDQAVTVPAGGTLRQKTSEVRGVVGNDGRLLRASTLNGEISLERCQ